MRTSLTPEWFRTRWSQAKNQAGKRFTEQLDVGLRLAEYFSAATQSESFFQQFADFAASLDDAWGGRPGDISSIGADEELRRLDALVPNIISALKHLAGLKQKAPEVLPISTIAANVKEAAEAIRTPYNAAFESSQATTLPEQKSRAEAWMNWLSGIREVLIEAKGLLTSDISECANTPVVLMLGVAGTGKTHLLCEMTKERIERDLPALLFLAQTFQSAFSDVLALLASSVGWKGPADDFFATLDAIAHQHNTRCLISIDAINEGHRDSWKQAVPQLIELTRRYQGLAVVISCRTPFETILIPDPTALGLVVVHHYGFPAEVQSAAVEKYFKGYGIPLPEVPLLEEEFASPLFLKLFCEALEKVTLKAKHQQIKDIAAGQIGMTHILEYFVDQKDRAIAKRPKHKLGSPGNS